jgi:hypothetical protein
MRRKSYNSDQTRAKFGFVTFENAANPAAVVEFFNFE